MCVNLCVCRCTPKGVIVLDDFSNLEKKLQSVQEQNGNSFHKHCNGIRFLKEALNYVGSFFHGVISHMEATLQT